MTHPPLRVDVALSTGDIRSARVPLVLSRRQLQRGLKYFAFSFQETKPLERFLVCHIDNHGLRSDGCCLTSPTPSLPPCLPSFLFFFDHITGRSGCLLQVIPAVGGEVLIVNGRCRGERATLLSLDTDAFAASVRVTSDGPDSGTVLDKVEYEDICKAVPVEGA